MSFDVSQERRKDAEELHTFRVLSKGKEIRTQRAEDSSRSGWSLRRVSGLRVRQAALEAGSREAGPLNSELKRVV